MSDETHDEWEATRRGEAPVIYAKLVDFACQQPERLIADHLVQSAREDARAVSALLVDAYNQGLRDGFQQGVQAMSEKP